MWKKSLVEHFIGQIPNFSKFQRTIDTLWGKGSKLELKSISKNLFVIQFPTNEARDFVLEGGQWHVNNQSIIVRKWERGMKGMKFSLAKVLVWVQLTNVPLKLFH